MWMLINQMLIWGTLSPDGNFQFTFFGLFLNRFYGVAAHIVLQGAPVISAYWCHGGRISQDPGSASRTSSLVLRACSLIKCRWPTKTKQDFLFHLLFQILPLCMAIKQPLCWYGDTFTDSSELSSTVILDHFCCSNTSPVWHLHGSLPASRLFFFILLNFIHWIK